MIDECPSTITPLSSSRRDPSRHGPRHQHAAAHPPVSVGGRTPTNWPRPQPLCNPTGPLTIELALMVPSAPTLQYQLCLCFVIVFCVARYRYKRLEERQGRQGCFSSTLQLNSCKFSRANQCNTFTMWYCANLRRE